jgi:type IV secretory pathway TraG/TraD family ATPase VirD4
VLDELASFNKLPKLHTAVTESRKYKNSVVPEFQGRSQLIPRAIQAYILKELLP